MNSPTKLHLGSAVYCTLLVGLNWFRSVEYSRQFGVMKESFAPVALAALISSTVVFYLIYRCVRAALRRLEDGRKVRAGKWIASWSVILYTLPLLWHQSSSSSSRDPDGVVTTVTRGYGDAVSSWIFLFAVLGLVLFQIFTRLTWNDEDAEPSGTDNSGAAPRRV